MGVMVVVVSGGGDCSGSNGGSGNGGGDCSGSNDVSG